MIVPHPFKADEGHGNQGGGAATAHKKAAPISA